MKNSNLIQTTRFLVFGVLFCAVLFTLGCEKSEIPIDQTVTTFDKKISDESFQSSISGLVTLPEGIPISDKVKKIILEHFEGANKQHFLDKGFHVEYSEKDILRLDSEGLTVKEETQQMLEQLGIDSSLPVEEQIELIQQNGAELRTSYGNWGITYVPHYYEWDENENLNGHNWCGHAVLKGVAEKHGQNKSLGQIHDVFCYNSPSNYCTGNICYYDPGSFCAGLADLYYSTNAYTNKWYNYDFPDSSMEPIYSLSNFYQRLRDGVDYDKPAIVPSHYLYSYGHFYSVVAYATKYNANGTINFNTSKIYLRDVADSSPGFYFDNKTTVSNFYNLMNGNQILFVRP